MDVNIIERYTYMYMYLLIYFLELIKANHWATVGVKKWWRFRSIRPVQTPLHHSCQPFRMHACIISNWAWSFDKQKKEGQLVDSLIVSRLEPRLTFGYGLLNCFGAVRYCRSSILSEFCDRGSTGFEVCYRLSIDLTSPIDTDRLQMRSLLFEASFSC